MRNYQDMVYSTAVRLVNNEAQAEDIAQEVFLKAYQQFDMLRDSPAVGGWLKTVATNLSINYMQRDKKRWRNFSDFARDDSESGSTEINFASPDHLVPGNESADRREQIELALNNLPEHQRLPLVLFHFEELSYETIAGKLGVSLSKIKMDILRGRQALAQILLRSDSPRRHSAAHLEQSGTP